MTLNHGEPVKVAVVAAGEGLVEQAVEELVWHLERLGIQATQSMRQPKEAKCILVGAGWNAAVDAKAKTLNRDGILIRDLGPSALLITGSGPRGVLNAVYAFLEDDLGIVWFNARETYWPKERSWNFDGLDIQYEPPFELRCIGAAASRDWAWVARKRLNFFTDDPPTNDPRLLDSFTFAGKHCHNVYKLLSLGFFGSRENPLELFENRDLIYELFTQHPEYFARWNGIRDPYPGDGLGGDLSDQSGNISLTNPEVWDLLVKGARLLLDHHPEAAIVALSLRDNYHYCEEAVSAPGGVQGAMIRLVNYFAEELERTHPKVRIDFIAYHGTQPPPKQARLHANVTVRYCPIRVSQYHSFDESRHNLQGGLNYETPPSMSQPARQLEQWRKIADRVIAWYYTLNLPYFHPQPSLRGHGRTFRLMHRLGISGVYIQDNAPMEQNCFNDLRVHVLTRLLWKPELDDQLEINRFCQLYYGPAAPQVLAYLELMHDENVWDWRNWPERDGKSKWASREYEESWDWFGDVPAEDFPEPHFYTLYHTRPPLQEPFFTRGNQLLNQALQAVEGKQIYHRRLEEWRMSFYYAVLSYPPEDDRLIEEAREWLKPRFEQLKKHYQGKVFNGLDQLGLAWPEPLERMTAC